MRATVQPPSKAAFQPRFARAQGWALGAGGPIGCVRGPMRALLFALFVPVLVSAGALSAGALFRCQMTQSLHASCCCPSSGADAASPTLERACCCERVELPGSLPSASLPDSQLASPAELTLAVVSPARTEPRDVFGLASPSVWPRRRFEARAGPSLIILYQRFLI